MAYVHEPESYHLQPTPHVPNSILPVLVYRNVLANALDEEGPSASSTQAQIERNAWRKGGVFKTYWRHHFHSVTHECYAVFKGSSTLLLGRGPQDDELMGEDGRTLVHLQSGDAIVLPAGVSHCSVSADEGYEYVGLYPEGSPKYDNNFCKAEADETLDKAVQAARVPIPHSDPIRGVGGPLVRIWSRAAGLDS